jgi:hypothetical protein
MKVFEYRNGLTATAAFDTMNALQGKGFEVKLVTETTRLRNGREKETGLFGIRAQRELTAEETNTAVLEKMGKWAESFIAEAKTSFEAFSNRFAVNPLDAFEWAESTVKAAGRNEIGHQLQHWLAADQPKASKIIEYLEDAVLRGAKYPSSSSSPMSNLAAQAKLAAYAELLERARNLMSFSVEL